MTTDAIRLGAGSGRRFARLCVTGGIACGKNLVGDVFREAGVPVCDSDAVCHALMRKGLPVYRSVVEAFGDGILGADGEIDRGRLGQQVFAAPPATLNVALRAGAGPLQLLNDLVHPEAGKAIRAWMAQQELSDEPAKGGETAPACLAVIVPLLYEAGWEADWDGVICVSASKGAQLRRLADRGLSESDALARLAAQWPIEEKMRRADYVIVNDGSRELARRQALRVLRHATNRMEKK